MSKQLPAWHDQGRESPGLSSQTHAYQPRPIPARRHRQPMSIHDEGCCCICPQVAVARHTKRCRAATGAIN
eukprot:1159037-Pelagomonas_calceolata.AAC.5